MFYYFHTGMWSSILMGFTNSTKNSKVGHFTGLNINIKYYYIFSIISNTNNTNVNEIVR